MSNLEIALALSQEWELIIYDHDCEKSDLHAVGEWTGYFRFRCAIGTSNFEIIIVIIIFGGIFLSCEFIIFGLLSQKPWL